MYRQIVVALGLLICVSPTVQHAAPYNAAETREDDGRTVSIRLDKMTLTKETLEVRYEIRNRSDHDIWICDSMNAGSFWHVDAYLASDNETLSIRRRFDIPMEGLGELPTGRYGRLWPGEVRTELLTISLPVLPRRVLSGGGPPQPLNYASRLSLEIGYYEEDLPGMIRALLRQTEEAVRSRSGDFPPSGPGLYLHYFGGLLYFARRNESVPNRSEQVSIPYTRQALKGERLLRLDIEKLRIPYLEQCGELVGPDLTPCTRVQMEFKPSALEFFFPYLDERELLSSEEKEDLSSLKNLVITDPGLLKAFADNMREPMDDMFAKDVGVAEVTCYCESERYLFLRIHSDSRIVNSKGQVFRYDTFWRGGGLPSVRRFVAQMRPLDLRLQCVDNLEDLWHRLRAYRTEPTYPEPQRWCDDIMEIFMTLTAMQRKDAKKPFECRSANNGECHYAMNPVCKADSPVDMVLLFETKAGWNQHGGPELFTFDNHDPKGGLVLLNDGTVKFIRTEEELKQLRWK